jgi:hypothetical protein
MSTHAGFTVAATLSLIVTLPLVVAAWRTQQTHRALVLVLYVAGYVFIAAALLLDPVVQPPLFIHGFVPGIGAGLIVTALALSVQSSG